MSSLEMKVTTSTKLIAYTGLGLSVLLGSIQFIAVLKPQDAWTIENIYGGSPSIGDSTAYFAWNQGSAWADSVFWSPLHILGSVGMLRGNKWGFLLGLMTSVPFWYSAIWIYIWDRDMGFRENTWTYWLIVFGMWPTFGVVEGVYLFARLLWEETEYPQLHT